MSLKMQTFLVLISIAGNLSQKFRLAPEGEECASWFNGYHEVGYYKLCKEAWNSLESEIDTTWKSRIETWKDAFEGEPTGEGCYMYNWEQREALVTFLYRRAYWNGKNDWTARKYQSKNEICVRINAKYPRIYAQCDDMGVYKIKNSPTYSQTVLSGSQPLKYTHLQEIPTVMKDWKDVFIYDWKEYPVQKGTNITVDCYNFGDAGAGFIASVHYDGSHFTTTKNSHWSNYDQTGVDKSGQSLVFTRQGSKPWDPNLIYKKIKETDAKWIWTDIWADKARKCSPFTNLTLSECETAAKDLKFNWAGQKYMNDYPDDCIMELKGNSRNLVYFNTHDPKLAAKEAFSTLWVPICKMTFEFAFDQGRGLDDGTLMHSRQP